MPKPKDPQIKCLNLRALTNEILKQRKEEKKKINKNCTIRGNRTRVILVAGEHRTDALSKNTL